MCGYYAIADRILMELGFPSLKWWEFRIFHPVFMKLSQH